jgi:hypothetical protein
MKIFPISNKKSYLKARTEQKEVSYDYLQLIRTNFVGFIEISIETWSDQIVGMILFEQSKID